MKETWIYLSPHLDDAIYSCGGLICRQVKSGAHVEVWTIFAGDAQVEKISLYARQLHQRWGTPDGSAAVRREEDKTASASLGVTCRHFDWPDVIYRKHQRKWMVRQDADLFDPRTPFESRLAGEIHAVLSAALPASANLVLPLGVGNHVDHRLVRWVGERLAGRLYYYADLPYGMRHPEEIGERTTGLSAHNQSLSPTCVSVWAGAMAAYQSQLDTFWPDEKALSQALAAYLGKPARFTIWQAA